MVAGGRSGRMERAGEATIALGAAVLADHLFGEPPPRLHPVVGLGRLIAALERRAPHGPTPRLAYGGAMTVVTVGVAAGAAALAARLAARLPRTGWALATGLLLKPAFATRVLLAAGAHVRIALDRGDLPAARLALRGLVSRDVTTLDAPLIAAAAVESVAENANDSMVAPWLAFFVAGLPGAYAYRAANTLDAMIGYRGHHEHLGKAAARLDDILNLVPARLTAALIVLAAPTAGGDARRALAVARRDHGRTASPNAGWPMAAMAGALGVRLEKVGHYRLGDPIRPVVAADIAGAGRIAVLRPAAAVLALAAVATVRSWRTS